jgi:hypothetical protein
MDINPIIQVHDALSHIQDMIAAWNPDEVGDNRNAHNVCLARRASNIDMRVMPIRSESNQIKHHKTKRYKCVRVR